MPAKSQSQQRFFGMVDAYKRGELKNPSKKIKDAAKGMTKKKVKDFAKTKHKGLPETVEENVVRLTESQFKRLISKSVKRVLYESKMYLPQAVYIVFDGTSHYGVYGMDVEEEIRNNDVEVVKGPFAKWDSRVDELIEDLNNEAYGTQY